MILVAIACSWGCRGQSEIAATLLADLLVQAEFDSEALVWLAEDAGEERAAATGGGWARSEVRNGTPIRWATSPESEIVFTIVQPRPMEIELSGWNIPWPDAPAQSIVVLVEGKSLGMFELVPGWPGRTYRLPWPVEKHRVGTERLVLAPLHPAPDHVVEPALYIQSPDSRHLGTISGKKLIF